MVMSIKHELISIIKQNTSIIYEDVVLSDETDILNDLGFSSITIMQLIVEIEDKFGIEFDEMLQYEEIDTLKKMSNYVTEKVSDKDRLIKVKP